MNILIIGGGPIGLFMGLILKEKQNDKVNINILEKREKYTRDNVIGLPVNEIKELLPKKIYNEIKSVSCFRKLGSTKCYLDELNIILIPLKKLETILFNECVKLGINFIYDSNYESHLNNINIIFIATGTNNIISEKLINTKYKSITEYYGMCMFFKPNKYRTYNKNTVNNKVKIKSKRYRIFPVRRPNKMYMGVSLSKEEHDLLENKSNLLKEKNEKMNINNLPLKIKSIVKNGLNYYNYKDTSEWDIFPVKFGIKYNSTIIKKIKHNNNNILVCLIGNQVYNHHFFAGKGIITGFLGSNFLNNHINPELKNGYSRNIISEYKKYMTNIRKEEWSEYPNIIVPFYEIDNLVKNMSKNELDKIAKKLNLPYYRINKKELSYILGCEYIKGCIGNKFARA